MLAITRRHGERVVLWLPDGRRVVVEVRHRRGDISVSFDAPRDVRIDREEVAEAMTGGRTHEGAQGAPGPDLGELAREFVRRKESAIGLAPFPADCGGESG